MKLSTEDGKKAEAVMPQLARTIPKLVLLLGLAGCADILGTGELDVTVAAHVNLAEKSVSFVIANRSSETIQYHPSWSPLERWDGNGWQRIPERLHIDVGIPPIPIGPGEDYADSGADPLGVLDGPDPGLWPGPGRYRYHLSISDEDGDILPEENRVSNSFRIEYHLERGAHRVNRTVSFWAHRQAEARQGPRAEPPPPPARTPVSVHDSGRSDRGRGSGSADR